jgi:tRNA pseudouridine38-40 synthase
VQQTLEEALLASLGISARITASGRTDAGVHAAGQVCHFDAECTVPAERMPDCLNRYLPPSIRVLEGWKGAPDFDSCRGAKRKTYRYTVYEGERENPLLERYATRVEKLPQTELLQSFARYMEGEHDFKAFCSSGSGAKTTVRTIYSIKIEKGSDGLKVLVTGNGFLYNMVRILVGTLLDVGYGKKTEKDILEMLSQGKRERGGRTLPAKGLCLVKVEYGE